MRLVANEYALLSRAEEIHRTLIDGMLEGEGVSGVIAAGRLVHVPLAPVADGGANLVLRHAAGTTHRISTVVRPGTVREPVSRRVRGGPERSKRPHAPLPRALKPDWPWQDGGIVDAQTGVKVLCQHVRNPLAHALGLPGPGGCPAAWTDR